MTRIAVASDHAGYHLKERLKAHLQAEGHILEDFGTDSDASVDFPDYIGPAAVGELNRTNRWSMDVLPLPASVHG